jgi:hypothetical protein
MEPTFIKSKEELKNFAIKMRLAAQQDIGGEMDYSGFDQEVIKRILSSPNSQVVVLPAPKPFKVLPLSIILTKEEDHWHLSMSVAAMPPVLKVPDPIAEAVAEGLFPEGYEKVKSPIPNSPVSHFICER